MDKLPLAMIYCGYKGWKGSCMSPRLPRITAVELLRALRRDGWVQVRQSGSHVIMKHPDMSRRIVVPNHIGVILKPKTLESILKQAGLTVEHIRSLL